MRILFVCGNLSNGGAQRVISVVSSELVELGHEITILMFNRTDDEYAVSEKVKLLSVRDTYDEYISLSKIARIREIRKYIKKVKPHVAIGFIQGGYALFLSALGLKFPKIATVRTNPVRIFHGNDKRGLINKIWFGSADAVAVQNGAQKNYILKEMNNKVFVAPNPISKTVIESDDHFYDRPCRRIIMVGRLAEEKNYGMAVNMMKEIVKTDPEIRLLIYGKGEKEEELKYLAATLSLTDNVLFMGWTDNIIGEMVKSDLFIQTSNHEGQPNALMEAMGLGLPCISTDCETGPKELIESGKTGFLVSMGDVEGLEQAVSRTIKMSSGEREKMGKAARVRILKEFNLKDVAIKWEKMFYEAVRLYN